MPDDAETQEQEQAEDEEQAAEGAAGAPAGFSRRRIAALAGLTLAAFVVSGAIALGVGGHFRRKPLSSLRGVPLLGRLVPAPEEPESEHEDVPNVAAVHPMPAVEISELIQELQATRDAFHARKEALAKDEERLKQLGLDLGSERDALEKLMARLAQRQAALGAEREELEADVIVAKAEERKRLTQLARIYEAQEAATAASELAMLDKSARDGLAVKIMGSMTEKKAAPIFDAMPPETAAAIKTRLLKLRFEISKKKGETS